MKKFGWILLISFVALWGERELPITKLNLYADALNVEGATITQHLRPEQVWANICVVLDRPFENGVEWKDITAKNTFPLKEASLLEYNEASVNYAYALILKYYLNQAHELTGKKRDEPVHILVHVHRNTSGPHQTALLAELEKIVRPQSASMVHIEYANGAYPEQMHRQGYYEHADIIVCFSLVAGLHPMWSSGTLVVPTRYIPFPLSHESITFGEMYTSENHLARAIETIIDEQDPELLHCINRQFLSMNPAKQTDRAAFFTEDDFKQATLLQVDRMFNPSELPATFFDAGYEAPLVEEG